MEFNFNQIKNQTFFKGQMIVKDWKYIETLRPSPEPLGQFNCHNTSLTNTAEFAAQMSYVANKAQLLSFFQG